MARTVQITVPSDRTDELVEQLHTLDDLIGLRVLRGASLKPKGDVVSVEVTNFSLHPLMRLIEEAGLVRDGKGSVTTSEPRSLISTPHARLIAHDSSEASWEEMDMILAKEGNMNANGLLLMATSGITAAVGMATGTLHLVIAAAVVAPGFEPIVRFVLGLVSRGARWKQALLATLKAYGVLAAASAATAWLLQAAGRTPLGGSGTYMPPDELLAYWTSFTLPSLLVSTAAGVAGTVLIEADRATLTAGALIALALIPTASVAGLGFGMGDWQLGALGALRWLTDVGLVVVTAFIILVWKRAHVQRRDTMM